MKVYVGCALMNAPEEFRFAVEQLKGELRKRGFEVLDFLGLIGGTPKDVYLQDIKGHASNCDILLALCDHPSIGVGYEIAVAVEVRGIPVLAVAHEQAQVSRLIEGVQHPLYTFRRYQDLLGDIPRLLEEKLEDVLEHYPILPPRVRHRG